MRSMAAQLMPETLYLTANLIDRFLEQKRVSRRNLQLVTNSLLRSRLNTLPAEQLSALCMQTYGAKPAFLSLFACQLFANAQHLRHQKWWLSCQVVLGCYECGAQVGVTAMLVASKYEEIWAPEVKDFVYISDKAYSRDQILQMEKIMLNTLAFNLTVPTPLDFLSRFAKAAGCTRDNEVGGHPCRPCARCPKPMAPVKHMLALCLTRSARDD